MKPLFTKYGWLTGSLCVWLLCAAIAQQPAPARKGQSKSHPASVPIKAHPITNALDGKAAHTSSVAIAVDTTKSGSGQHDPETGLALDKNLMLVKGQCTACHSSKLILQSHFDREKWIERIRWMQRTQKLWDLGESEPAILTYLTTYYGPTKTPFDGRRLPLETPVWHKQAGH